MKSFLFQHPAGGPCRGRAITSSSFHLEVIMGFNGGLGEEEGFTNVASVYKKHEGLKRLAGFRG